MRFHALRLRKATKKINKKHYQQSTVLINPLSYGNHGFFKAGINSASDQESVLFFKNLLKHIPNIAKEIKTTPAALLIYLSYLLPRVGANLQSFLVTDHASGEMVGLNTTADFAAELTANLNSTWMNCSFDIAIKSLNLYWINQSTYDCWFDFDMGISYNATSINQKNLFDCIEDYSELNCWIAMGTSAFAAFMALLLIIVIVCITCYCCCDNFRTNSSNLIRRTFNNLLELICGTYNNVVGRFFGSAPSEQNNLITGQPQGYGTTRIDDNRSAVVTIPADADTNEATTNRLFPL
jgi:hypothetical protein